MPHVKKVTDSTTIEFTINFLFAAIFAFILYTILGIAFGTGSPLVIIFSASMEHNLYRGDVIALRAPNVNDYFGPEVNLERNIDREPTINFAMPVYENDNLQKI